MVCDFLILCQQRIWSLGFEGSEVNVWICISNIRTTCCRTADTSVILRLQSSLVVDTPRTISYFGAPGRLVPKLTVACPA